MLTPEEIKWAACSPAVPPGASCAVIEGILAAVNALFAYRVKMPVKRLFRSMPLGPGD
jgi:hypothetical protein